MRILFITAALFLNGCAVLHKTQIGEIDNRAGQSSVPFEIKVSETGVDLGQVVAASRFFKPNTGASALGKIAGFVSLFQQGPRTGAGVYVSDYAEGMMKAIHAACPNGGITGVTSIRETRKYPVVSGEIVKIQGFCNHSKRADSAEPELPEPKLYAGEN